MRLARNVTQIGFQLRSPSLRPFLFAVPTKMYDTSWARDACVPNRRCGSRKDPCWRSCEQLETGAIGYVEAVCAHLSSKACAEDVVYCLADAGNVGQNDGWQIG